MRPILILSALTLLLVALIAAPAALASPAKPVTGADFAAVDDYLAAQMREQRIPGLALVIVQGDEVLYQRGYGQASPDRQATAQTPFILGSTSKSFAAVAIMQQVEAGKIDLDAPVQRYLPWFTLADPDAAAQITIRMLLGHISGLPTKAGEDWLAKRDNDPSALERKVRALQSVQPAHRPGTVYEYCNANYDTLGLVVQTVSGQPYGDYVVEHIFAPLGMRHAHISYPESQGDGLAEGYRYWFGLPLPAENMPFLYAALPSGNLMLSAEDLGPYLLAHLNDGSYRGVQLVSSAGMHQLHAPIANNYAMGWAWQNNLLTHNGAVPGFGSTFLLDPDRKIGVAVLWNVNTGGGGIPAYGLAENVWRIQTGQLLAPLPSDRQYATYLGVFSMVLLLELAWLFVSLRLLRSWRTNPSSGRSRGWIAGLSAFIQLGLGTAVVVLLAQQGRPVSVMFLFVPDLMTLSALVLALAFGWGMVFPLLTLLYTKGRKLYLV